MDHQAVREAFERVSPSFIKAFTAPEQKEIARLRKRNAALVLELARLEPQEDVISIAEVVRPLVREMVADYIKHYLPASEV